MAMISQDISRHISSRASEDGRSPCASPDGPTLDLFGQEVVPANPSVPPGKVRVPMTRVICGLRGHLLSDSAALQLSLESRLRRRLDGAGSTLFSTIWRRKATPAGRPYFQLAALVRRTSAIGFGSWPTPMAGTPAQNGNNEAGNNDASRLTVGLAPWPTPQVDSFRSRSGDRKDEMGLDQLARSTAAAWPTPTEGDHKASGSRNTPNSKAHSGISLTDAALALASWSTPNGDDANNVTRKSGSFQSLARQSQTAWATPSARDYKGANSEIHVREVGTGRKHMDQLANQVVHSGPISSGSHAPTANKGQLNPAFSLWLMGYGTEWLNSAPQAMRLSRRSRQSSSKQ